jgi:hypothetical protein
LDFTVPFAENPPMPLLRPAFLLTALLAPLAWAQQPAPTPATSESRDAAMAYVGTGNFIVGRLARECLAMVGRSETPQEFVAQWQQRNAQYMAASEKYMNKRLEEAVASGGADKREAVLQSMRTAVLSGGEQAVRGMLQNGRREEACMRAISLLDAGALDISPKTPIYPELEALVRWAQQ